MRDNSPDLSLPASAVAREAANEKPLPPALVPSGRLFQAGRQYLIPDAVTTVAVERDGTAHFHDKPDFEIHFPALALLHPRAIGKALADWYKDPEAQTRVGTYQDLPAHEQAVPGGWDSGSSAAGGLPIASGGFDLTAWAMRKAHVGDPYLARKRALLDNTRDERVAQGTVYRAAQLDRSAAIMRDNLAAMWGAPGDAASHRAALFELWDECAEGDNQLGAAGARARAMVIGFIRANLPADSALAFTPAELATLDARRTSTQHFAPYTD